MEETIKLQDVIKIIKKRLFLIISFIVISVGITAGISFYILPNIYEAQTQILVNQKNGVQETNAWNQIETDIQLIHTYNVIIKSPAILNKVIEELGLNTTLEELSEQIEVSNEDKSKVVNIIVADQNSKQAVNIANMVAEVFKNEIPTLMSVDNINILSEAIENPIPVKPNKLLNMVIAAVVGLLIGISLAFLLEALDSTVKTEKDIAEMMDTPIIGIVSSIKTVKENRSISKSRRLRGN